MFQSSPDPRAECCRRDWPRDPSAPRVFQSSPDPRAECCRIPDSVSAGTSGFNPHPTLGPSAARNTTGLAGWRESFQSSPDPRAECCTQLVCKAPTAVSSRVLRATRPGWRAGASRFNPHPTLGPSAAVSAMSVSVRSTVFQSSPDPRAECCPTHPHGLCMRRCHHTWFHTVRIGYGEHSGGACRCHRVYPVLKDVRGSPRGWLCTTGSHIVSGIRVSKGLAGRRTVRCRILADAS